MRLGKLKLLLVLVLSFTVSAACFAAGYHVYEWKGPARQKDGKDIRKSKWQPGFVLPREGDRRAGKIMVTTIDGRIAEVGFKGDGKRKKTYATGDLKAFGLSLSVADLEKSHGKANTKFGPGTLELADGRRLEGILGAATLDNGLVYSIAYAPARDKNLTSYFSREVKRALLTIDGIELEYQSSDDGFVKVPTLAEYRTFHHKDDSRNPHTGSLLLPSGERIDGQVLLVKDGDGTPALGAMVFYEDGYGNYWNASELSRVSQVIDHQSHYWTSYGANLEQLPTLKAYAAEPRREASRNAHPGQIVLRNERVLEGSVAFVKTKNGVNSIEVFFFDTEGVPYSYGGSDVVQVTQNIDGEAHHYIPYQDLVFVELLSEGQPYQLHANPFPEREDQFKTAVARGLVSALLQGAAYKLGQQGLGNAAVFSVSGCETSGSCSSRNSLRTAIETMVPTFKKNEFVLHRDGQGDIVLFKKNFKNEIQHRLDTCPAYAELSRREQIKLLNFSDPGRAVSYLNTCAKAAPDSSAAPVTELVQREAGEVFQDAMKNGAKGPSMVMIPAGNYQMGDQTGTHGNEIPVHRVRFAQPFAVSRFEITLAEFDRFTTSTGRVRRAGQLSKKPHSPVRGIAWIDAMAYAQWLSGQTGYHYRLPTEAEWEYSARAGSATAYPWGDALAKDQVRCEACGDKKSKLEKVGQFPANKFGLYDVVGSVWEWVADCWHPEYSGAPSHGNAWMDAGDCNLRVLRGGSVKNSAAQLRVAFRTASSPVNRDSFVGFRVARDL